MTDSASAANLRALVRLLSQSVEEVIEEYTKAGQPIPSLSILENGPFDALETSTDRLAKAIRVIEGACAQLAATVPAPGRVLSTKALSFLEPACLNLATTVKIADHLEGNESGTPLDELSVKTGVDKGKLGRVLRYLATKHVFCETSPDVFCNNRLSIKLKLSDPVASLVGHHSDEIMMASHKLSVTLMDPEFGHSNSAQHTAFNKAFDRGLIEYYLSEDGREAGMRCGRAMVGAAQVTGTVQSLAAYPWDQLPNGTRVCDVGSGSGHVILEVLKKHSGLWAVIQDLPSSLPMAQTLWESALPAAIAEQRVEFVGFNFLKDKPRNDCGVFYLRSVIHDWPDAEALKILGNVRAAMSRGNSLLLHEYLLQPTLVEKTAYGKAPEPLLPNYGVGGVGAYHSDLVMMGCLNSRERSLDEYVLLCSRAGFEFVKMWGNGDMPILDFRPI